jgi:excisionase family DNA binding protein
MSNLIVISETDLRTIMSETIQRELASFKPVEQSKNNSLITRQETANLLGISLPTLSTYSKEGKIQSYRIGTRIRFKYDEVINSVSKIQTLKYR